MQTRVVGPRHGTLVLGEDIDIGSRHCDKTKQVGCYRKFLRMFAAKQARVSTYAKIVVITIALLAY